MSKPVLFVTGLGESLDRAENLKALFDSYQGEKKFISSHSPTYAYEVRSGKYDFMVIDVFPTMSIGKTIMIWHAIQGGKLIGLDEQKTYYKEQYARFIDRIVVAGRGGIEMFNRCTGVPKDRIVNLGMPRTDRYIGKKKGDGGTILALYSKAYLYAPTFRNRYETPMPMIDWGYLDKTLTDDEIIAVKSHPYGFHKLVQGNYKHIVEIPSMDPSVDYLYDADVVITDYSSIMFDAYLMKKPVVLFEKHPGYTKTRGMYLDYPREYCSFYATEEGSLLNMMRFRSNHPWLTEKEANCVDFVADMCDGHSCERICKLIDEMRGE